MPFIFFLTILPSQFFSVCLSLYLAIPLSVYPFSMSISVCLYVYLCYVYLSIKKTHVTFNIPTSFRYLLYIWFTFFISIFIFLSHSIFMLPVLNSIHINSSFFDHQAFSLSIYRILSSLFILSLPVWIYVTQKTCIIMLRRRRKNARADDGQWQNKTNHELLLSAVVSQSGPVGNI